MCCTCVLWNSLLFLSYTLTSLPDYHYTPSRYIQPFLVKPSCTSEPLFEPVSWFCLPDLLPLPHWLTSHVPNLFGIKTLQMFHLFPHCYSFFCAWQVASHFLHFNISGIPSHKPYTSHQKETKRDKKRPEIPNFVGQQKIRWTMCTYYCFLN